MHKIVYELIYERIPAEQCQKIVNALGLWIACCLPDEMLLGDSGITLQENAKQKNNEIDFCYLDARQHVHAVLQREYPGIPGHFIAHPQINCVLHKLDISLSPSLRYRIPVMLNVHERTFASTNAHLEKHGQPVKGRVPFVMNQIYQKTNRINHWKLPDESTYLYAHHYGLISEKSLHYHLMAPGFFKNALKLITAVCAMRPAYGDTVSSRTFSMYGGYGIRRSYDDFIGKNAELNEEQLSLVELCRRTAQKLVPIVVNAELQRGDTPTDYSSYVTGIHVLSGMETFVRILSALGKDTLDRSVYYWGNSQEL